MSSSKSFTRYTRRALLLGAVAVMAGCGFAPIYGENGSASNLRGKVAYDTPDTLDGYHMRERLQRRLGPTETADYQLTVRTTLSSSSVGIAEDSTVLRATLTGSATFSLVDSAGNVVTNGTVETFSGYSTTGNVVSTRSAEQDAHERLSIALADLVVAHILAAQVADKP